MMIRYIVFFLSVIFTLNCFAQKQQEIRIEADALEGINIASDEISEIEITTSTENTVKISSGVQGETYQSMLINTSVEDGYLNITSGRTPFYKAIDDKLAAHKVLSVVLKLTIPKNLKLRITNTLASVNLTGTFESINLNLGQGDCNLNDFLGNGTVNTRSGSITVRTQKTKIEANSRHGSVTVEDAPIETHRLELKSLTGSISVTQSE